jgi:hypothetical protein
MASEHSLRAVLDWLTRRLQECGFRAKPAGDSELKAATHSEAKAATHSELKAATF